MDGRVLFPQLPCAVYWLGANQGHVYHVPSLRACLVCRGRVETLYSSMMGWMPEMVLFLSVEETFPG